MVDQMLHHFVLIHSLLSKLKKLSLKIYTYTFIHTHLQEQK